jgi:hypothetical protein
MSARDLPFNLRRLTSTVSVNPDHVVCAKITMSRRTAQAGPIRWQIETRAGRDCLGGRGPTG